MGVPVLQLNCGAVADAGDWKLFLDAEICSEDLRLESVMCIGLASEFLVDVGNAL